MNKYDSIKQDFLIIDSIIEKQFGVTKNILLSIRSNFAFHYNTWVRKSRLNLIFSIVDKILRTFLRILISLFVVFDLEDNSTEFGMLISSSTDLRISKENNIPAIFLKKKFSFHNNNYLTVLIKAIKALFENNVSVLRILYILSELINITKILHEIKFSASLKVLVTENDSDPVYAALVILANEASVETLKIENSFIDDVNHNLILCSNYFYPNDYFKNIRKKFKDNRKVKLIPGGFVDLDKLKSREKSSFLTYKILYFTQPLITELDQLYIQDILDVISPAWKLIIKVHPRDNKKNYKKFIQNKINVDIICQCQDIYELIQSAEVNFSVMSFLTLEAKHITDSSFFINYKTDVWESYFNYSLFGDSIQTIQSKAELLKAVICVNNKRSIDHIACLNKSFPESGNKLISSIRCLLDESN